MVMVMVDDSMMVIRFFWWKYEKVMEIINVYGLWQ